MKFDKSLIVAVPVFFVGYLFATVTNTKDFFDQISSIGSMLAGTGTIALAYFGYEGLDQWRNQIKYEKKYNLLSEIDTTAFISSDLFNTIVKLLSEQIKSVSKNEKERFKKAEELADLEAQFKIKLNDIINVYYQCRPLLSIEQSRILKNAIMNYIEKTGIIHSGIKKSNGVLPYAHLNQQLQEVNHYLKQIEGICNVYKLENEE